MPLVPFHTPWKHQKTEGFRCFQRVKKETTRIKCVKHNIWHFNLVSFITALCMYSETYVEPSLTYTIVHIYFYKKVPLSLLSWSSMVASLNHNKKKTISQHRFPPTPFIMRPSFIDIRLCSIPSVRNIYTLYFKQATTSGTYLQSWQERDTRSK